MQWRIGLLEFYGLVDYDLLKGFQDDHQHIRIQFYTVFALCALQYYIGKHERNADSDTYRDTDVVSGG